MTETKKKASPRKEMLSKPVKPSEIDKIVKGIIQNSIFEFPKPLPLSQLCQICSEIWEAEP
eukprot:snap_masked-scaffold_21-processed-gene-5.89-mRNA-1 protein AED:1.00 eAED:1.00 QI:0/-1/0/0/-1/1/1/0/60